MRGEGEVGAVCWVEGGIEDGDAEGRGGCRGRERPGWVGGID